MLFRLVPHPSSPSTAIDKVEGEIRPAGPTTLLIKYLVVGRVRQMRLPPPATAQRRDGLWQHTCFEAFIGSPEGEAYYELNFSPSSEWAAYRFDSYRGGMREAGEFPAPSIMLRDGETRIWELRTKIDLGALAAEGRPWRLGLSAVIEEKDGTKSYWALAHPPGAPDFHRRDCFALELPPPEAS